MWSNNGDNGQPCLTPSPMITDLQSTHSIPSLYKGYLLANYQQLNIQYDTGSNNDEGGLVTLESKHLGIKLRDINFHK